MKSAVLLLLRLYKLCISPYLGQNCRFYPSCSEYASEAVATHGALHGAWLAARRLGKCHPWHAGGLDPVPCKAAHDGHADHAAAHPASANSGSVHSSPATARGCGHS
jgi:putative membrane protein insertion efficiency factor